MKWVVRLVILAVLVLVAHRAYNTVVARIFEPPADMIASEIWWDDAYRDLRPVLPGRDFKNATVVSGRSECRPYGSSSAELELLIDEQGRYLDGRIISSNDAWFARCILSEFADEGKFTPAMYRGRPVPSIVRANIHGSVVSCPMPRR